VSVDRHQLPLGGAFDIYVECERVVLVRDGPTPSFLAEAHREVKSALRTSLQFVRRPAAHQGRREDHVVGGDLEDSPSDGHRRNDSHAFR